MEKLVNDILLRNVDILSKHSAEEDNMMPEGSAPLPSVESVREIVSLVKCIIFSDYFYQRQPQQEIRSYYIGVKMEELYKVLRLQIARGLLFCSCMGEEEAMTRAKELTLQFIDQLPELKRVLYTDIKAMFDNDPAAQTYGEVIFSYPVVNAMTHYRIAHALWTM